ncbi:MAG TPA: hypothetical protein VNM89_07230 [Solirubrobacterales bacterium]|nr:hypothetical protein [Solirubrobacterales bacterium]
MNTDMEVWRGMRRLQATMPPAILAGALVFLMAFGLFGATTSSLTGYEDETAAVTEGLVVGGHFYQLDDSPLKSQGVLGKGGHLYARTGLLQPLIEAPFYAVGRFIDSNFAAEGSFQWGQTILWFFNPFVAALAAVALFALIYLTRRSIGWAAVIAALFVLASIAWPYAKIGMETTFMFAIIAAFALAAWARQKPTLLSWSLAGFAAGAAAATKGYAVFSLLAIAVLLWPTFVKLDQRTRIRQATAFALPILVWGVAIAWYNWARFGSPTDFGYSDFALTVSMPINIVGLLFSPGKGLIFYSPLVILGALGLTRLWRQDRFLAAALLTLLITLTCASGASAYWGDEVWGPRYIVPAAWTLLVPIAWWADTKLRRRVLLGVASLGVLVQMIAISAPYSQYVAVVRAMTGVEVYGERFGVNIEKLPYGDDPPRWIPEVSPLLVQAEGLISSQIVERLGGSGLEVTYHPLEGRTRTVNMSAPGIRIAGDFWWHGPYNSTKAHAAALLMFLVSLASGLGLYLVSTGRSLSRGSREPHA